MPKQITQKEFTEALERTPKGSKWDKYLNGQPWVVTAIDIRAWGWQDVFGGLKAARRMIRARAQELGMQLRSHIPAEHNELYIQARKK